MRTKLSSVIIISILIFNTTIMSWNFNSYAKDLDLGTEDISNSKSNELSRESDFEWSEIEVISEPILGQNIMINNSQNAKMAFEDDKIYVVWQDYTDYNGAGGDWDIFFRYFDGNQWSEIQVISEPVKGQNFNIVESYVPNIAVENGKIYIVWIDKNNTYNAGSDFDIFYRCNLTGTNWENIQVISEPIQGQDTNVGESGDADIDVENGKIYVVWLDRNNTNNAGNDLDIFYSCNITGKGWKPVQVISEPEKNKNINTKNSIDPKIEVENGKVYIVWADENNTNNASGFSHDYDIFLRYTLNGISWDPIQVVSEPIFGHDYNIMTSRYPKIAIEEGKIYIVWVDENNTNGAGEDSDIFYRCNLTSNNWENIQVISEPKQGLNLNSGDSRYPSIAVENGRLYVVWSGSKVLYRYNFNGSSWESIQVISEGYFPDIIVNLGKSYIIWSDDSNISNSGFDNDVLFSWIKDPSPLFINSPTVSPKLGNTSAEFAFNVTYFNYDDIAPLDVKAIIDDIEYQMTDVELSDTNFVDGKDYFFKMKNVDIGIHKFYFYATDGSYTWSTAIINKPIVYNTPPKITTAINNTAIEDRYFEMNYDYNDIDVLNVDQLITWDFSTNASWLEFNSTTQVLNGTPSNDDVGEYWVNVSIFDTYDYDYSSFKLTVINVNDQPKITTDDITLIIVGELYSVDYEAIDIDSLLSKQTWSLETNASWLKVNSSTGVLDGVPTNNDVGWYYVNITVYDGNGGVDWHDFILNVIKRNEPPGITTQDMLFAIVNITFKIDYNATDDRTNPDNLPWSLTTNAEWLSIDPNTGILTGTPKFSDIGGYLINISVSDLEGGWDYHEFILQVIEDPSKNRGPDLTNPKMTPLEGYNETEFTFTIHYHDKDGDPPSFIRAVIDGISMNMTLQTGGESNGTYILKTKLSSGIHTYYFTAFDGLNTIKTDNYLTPEIKKLGETDTEESFWYWIILIVIILIIIISLMVIYVYIRRKAKKIPTVRAELLHAPPAHMALPSITSGTVGVKPLPPQPIISEQLPTPKVTTPSLAPSPAKTLLQLPQATLSKAQKLGLLEERFLRGEVDLETYKELKTKIESSTGGEIPEGEIEDLSTIDEQPPILQDPPEQPPTPETPPEVTLQVPQVQPEPQPVPMPQVEEQPKPLPTSQVEQPPQVEAQEPAVEQTAEPQGADSVPKIKTQPTVEENDT